MEEDAKVQWHMEYAPEKHSIGTERVDNQVRSCNVCGV